MHINNISNNLPKIQKKEKNLQNNSQNVSFQGNQNNSSNGKNLARVGAGVLSILTLTSTLSGCKADAQLPATSQIEESFSQESLNGMGSVLDAHIPSGKIQTVDVGFVSMPVTEFYFSNAAREVTYSPDSDIDVNESGSVIVTITEDKSDRKIEGNTLGEIISKVYSTALADYTGDEQTSLRNKIIDEVIQANPALSTYVHSELGEDADSYDAIASLNLYSGNTSSDETLDVRVLSMPTEIVYLSQGNGPTTVDNLHSSNTYVPVISSGSVIKGEDNLLDGEFSSFSEMIYAAYGDDLSDEAYRDIVYAVVNAPQNATEFEYVLDEMNVLDLFTVGNIHDLNRVIEANSSDLLLDITLPSVTTLRTQRGNVLIDDGSKNAPIYQISPSAPVNGLNDRAIALKDKDGQMQAGDVYELRHVLQYYYSPNGQGRFAHVDENGTFWVQEGVSYWDEFDTNIMQQVVYANPNIFAAPYEDANGYYPYGVFNVNDGYDTTGKSLDEIIQNSSIDLERMWNYSFVDANGESLFEDGVELNLPQFNYRINKGAVASTKPSEPTKPTSPEDTPEPPCDDDPTFPTVPEDEPTIPDDTPEPPCDDEPTFPTTPEDEPTIPDDTPEPPCDDEPTFPTVPEDEPEIPVVTPQPTPQPSSEPEIPSQPSASDIPAVDPVCDDDNEDVVIQPEPEPELPSQQPSTPPATGPSSEPACDDTEIYEEIVDEEEPDLP